MSQALSGYRIVDFTQVLAGPFATQQLAQLGADVIKIEMPGVGDMTRGGLTALSEGKTSPSFTTCNIGKRSITLDLKHPGAKAVVHRLVASADAVVQNFKPGVMERLDFTYESLRKIKPDLVYCSISGYGQSGPSSDRPAFDGAIQADSGMMSITGTPSSGPLRTGYFSVDMSTALNAAFSITAALLRRERTGLGQHVDVAMMDTALCLVAPQLSAFMSLGRLPELQGNASPTGQPTGNVFATADGFLQVVALRDSQVVKLFEEMQLNELLDKFPSQRDRIKHNPEITAIMAEAFLTDTTANWFDRLLAAGVPVANVRPLDEVAEDPQLATRKIIASVEQGGEMTRTVSASHSTDVDPPTVQRPAPELGQHTNEILTELGFDEAARNELAQAGVV